ncbi:papain-like cysteine protease family protein [Streptomyces sp. NPDC059398]|uniref:papain-like cysteine protease family protein n=1 Tax=Streptomyces sp. NPDC059398 TaxID=3346820 RepID=UPI003696157C
MTTPLRSRGRLRPGLRRPVAAATVAVTALTGIATASATPASAVTGSKVLTGYTQQIQQQSNWCWAASGTSIAVYEGSDITQTQFCNAGQGRPTSNTTCPDNQGDIPMVQKGFRAAGVSAGQEVDNTVSYSTVQSEINANRPLQTRIVWSSGGGHMEVVYGYDTSKGLIYWGNPLGDNGSYQRYNQTTYDYYVSNGTFSWTHTIDRIGA